MTFRGSQDVARPLMACTTLSANSRACLPGGREEPVSFMSCGAELWARQQGWPFRGSCHMGLKRLF